MNQISRRVLVPAAILAGLCPLVANSLHEDAVGDGDEILAEAAAGMPVAGQFSVVLVLLGFKAMIGVLATLSAAIARRTPTLAGVAAIGGAAAMAVKMAEAQTGIAASGGMRSPRMLRGVPGTSQGTPAGSGSGYFFS